MVANYRILFNDLCVDKVYVAGGFISPINDIVERQVISLPMV